ncbi:Xaa-Pro dipeptidase [Devosia sp. UYZn731]|uniref:M24 family metallopeptidase n=1 Tax=Devosia sp. UYZn731 TaxID=3156345 RepID=UPI0033959A79
MTLLASIDRISDTRLLERIAAARRIMAEAQVDVLMVYSHPRPGGGVLQYLSGWATKAGTILLLPREGRGVILSAGPNNTRVFNQRCGFFADARAYGPNASLPKLLADGLAEFGVAGGKIGVSGTPYMPAPLKASLDGMVKEQVFLGDALDALRLVRHADEVAMHQRAADISVAMIERVMELARLPDTTPSDLMTECEFTGRKLGADSSGLWLATGEKPPTTYFELFELNETLGPKDRVQLGTTVTYEGHFGQCLRTGIRGGVSPAMQDARSRMVEMQDRALATLIPGAPMQNLVDRLEADIDAFCPYTRATDPFRFQSCHALGINYSDPSYGQAVNPERDRSKDGELPLIAENMIFEIHPNFTLPELGHVCIGDMALVTATGAKWITNHPREIVRLD